MLQGFAVDSKPPNNCVNQAVHETIIGDRECQLTTNLSRPHLSCIDKDQQLSSHRRGNGEKRSAFVGTGAAVRAGHENG